MNTPSNYDFQQYAAQMKAVESAPLTERKEARAAFDALIALAEELE